MQASTTAPEFRTAIPPTHRLPMAKAHAYLQIKISRLLRTCIGTGARIYSALLDLLPPDSKPALPSHPSSVLHMLHGYRNPSPPE